MNDDHDAPDAGTYPIDEDTWYAALAREREAEQYADSYYASTYDDDTFDELREAA
jgi:hypothetical protein